jgi:thiosulfate/3-mercaptopyruvate sulfurtransferase
MQPQPLITAEALASELDGPAPPAVLDVRWQLASGADRAGYEAGHVPGAAFVDLDRELAAPPGSGGRHPLPGAAAFSAAMRHAGVRQGRPVVAYDAGDLLGAARAWWLLGWFGHGDARVLDGGLRAWSAAGLPLATGPAAQDPAAGAGDFAARPGGRPVLDAAAAAGAARDGVLLDARTAVRFRGEDEPIDPVAGHIPGARNVPAAELFGPDGRLLPPRALRERFAGAGVSEATSPLGAYCGSGVTAAVTVLALTVAGFDAAMYPGSWSEWITDPARSVATGEPAPGW